MVSFDYDVIIIGQGVAGTTLAWVLQNSGKNVLVLDEWAETSSSRIAAGLITPITGKRFVVSRDFDTFYQTATSFYERVGEAFGESVFHERTAKRFLRSDEEKTLWSRRLNDPETQKYVLRNMPNDAGFDMRGAQLDVADYLTKSRLLLHVEPKKIDWKRDVHFIDNHVQVCGATTNYVISCEGFAASQNPYFEWVPFNAAKGEILKVRFEKEVEVATYHFGLWMAPARDTNTFFVGATYDWEHLNQEPTDQGRAYIEKRLRKFTDTPFQTIAHQAAVRPIIFQSIAVIGKHPEFPQLGYFNGLGSKGSLQAPWYAHAFSDHLFTGSKIVKECDVAKYWP